MFARGEGEEGSLISTRVFKNREWRRTDALLVSSMKRVWEWVGEGEEREERRARREMKIVMNVDFALVSALVYRDPTFRIRIRD